MIEEKINLEWRKFSGQFIMCLLALMGGIHASLHFFVAKGTRIAFADSDIGFIIGALLVIGTFYAALWVIRVPYKKDMFERRLRNWSMTYAAIMVLLFSATINIAYQAYDKGGFLITPYMMPGIWLLSYIIYAQYTRYCIATGRKNSFLDGSSC
ncbi:MAG: hypothetical protein ABJG88_00350 [Litorimonas sp.]